MASTVSTEHFIRPETFSQVYLAGPMAGKPERNYPAFKAATADLRARGLTVICPTEAGEEIALGREAVPGTDLWSEIMSAVLQGVISPKTDALVTLDGWTSSTGASLEAYLAHTLGKPVLAYRGPDRDFTPVYMRPCKHSWVALHRPVLPRG